MRHNYTNRKDALRALRGDRVKKNKFLWFLFALSFVFSFLCPLLINLKYCDIFYPTENAILNGFANISFGYFSGFLVYLFSSFFPETKRDVEIMDSIYFNLYNISMTLDYIEQDFLPENAKVNTKIIRTNLCNYLVKDRIIEHFDTTEDLPSTLIVDCIHYKALEMRLTIVSDLIDKLITSYRRELRSEEIHYLSSLANVKDLLKKIVENDNVSINKDGLYIFIMDYIQYRILFYSKVCPNYMRYKYCKYNISHYN